MQQDKILKILTGKIWEILMKMVTGGKSGKSSLRAAHEAVVPVVDGADEGGHVLLHLRHVGCSGRRHTHCRLQYGRNF